MAVPGDDQGSDMHLRVSLGEQAHILGERVDELTKVVRRCDTLLIAECFPFIPQCIRGMPPRKPPCSVMDALWDGGNSRERG